MLASTNIVTPVGAQKTTTTTTGNTTTITSLRPSSSGIKLSAQPILQERTTTTSLTPVNQTHLIAVYSGNGSWTLPNTTETINFTTNGTARISTMTNSAQAKETLMTDQGETATATLYEIVQFSHEPPSPGKGIVTAVFQTNSTGTLAPLNGMIAAGIDDMAANGESHLTLWKWESGISNASVSASSSGTSNNNSTSEAPTTSNSFTTEGTATSSANNSSSDNTDTLTTTANEPSSSSSLPPPTTTPPASLTAPY
jgi:hypothetical protein